MTSVTLGTWSLWLSLVVSVLTTILALSGKESMSAWVRKATYINAGVLSTSVVVLQAALITLDFQLQYVADYTSSTLSIPYRIGAMWAGQGGSLLLWAWMVSILAALIAYLGQVRNWGIPVQSLGVFSLVVGLFAGLAVYAANPFAGAQAQLPDGMGLNPLLQDPLQIIHPLALYGGYVLYTVPFAIIVGALMKGVYSGKLVKVATLWGVIAWIALTVGIALGARWAYAELGWGGYWAWDPVENASLLPWLTGTLLLHTGLTWRGGSRLRLGAVVMLMVTFNLCLFGTFLTRSGVISSVHAFGESNLGVLLGTAIALLVVACGVLVVWRLPYLKQPRPEFRGWLGQRILFLLLTAMTIVVLWGTMYPLFARVLNGEEISVTGGFFRLTVTPLAIAVLALFAVSGLLPGQRDENYRREALARVAVFLAVFATVMVATRAANPGVALVLALAVLALWTIAVKAARRVRQVPAGQVFEKIRACGPYVGHVGLVVMLTAIAFNVAFQLTDKVRIEEGGTGQAAGQVLRMDSLDVTDLPDRRSYAANLTLNPDSGGTALVTKQEQFTNAETLHAEVGIVSGPLRDVYVVLEEADGTVPGQAWVIVTVYSNPAVIWLWLGSALLAVGGVLYAVPGRRRKSGTIGTGNNDLDENQGPDQESTMGADRKAQDETEKLLVLFDEAMNSVKSGTEPDDAAAAAIVASARGIIAKSNPEAGDDEVLVFLQAGKDKLLGKTAVPIKQVAPAVEETVADAGEKTGSMKGLWVVLGIVGAIIVLAGAYIMGASSKSAVPEVDPNAPVVESSTSAAPAVVDPAKVSELEAKVKANPKDTNSMLALGDIYFNSNDYAKAGEWYKKVVAVDPKNDTAWVAVGAAAFNAGDDKTAKEAWVKATTVNPKNQEAFYDLGFWYLSQTPPDNENAKKAWQTVIDIDPSTDMAKTVSQHLASLEGSASPASPAPAGSTAGESSSAAPSSSPSD